MGGREGGKEEDMKTKGERGRGREREKIKDVY